MTNKGKRPVNRTLKPEGVRFTIEVMIDRDLSDPLVVQMREYVEEAVACWYGQRHPDDPMWDIKEVAVEATHVLNRNKAKWRLYHPSF